MSDENKVDEDRRRFLLRCSAAAVAVGATGLAGGAVAGCGGGGPMNTGFTASQITMGQCMVATSAGVMVLRDAGGLYAMSAICTHEGTRLSCPSMAGVIECPLHHRRYDINGTMTDLGMSENTPNPNLPHYAITFSTMPATATSQIIVNTAMVVAATARTMPPA
jgi:nitrite reductase/ring-hydroxylating ferredoxin subunit